MNTDSNAASPARSSRRFQLNPYQRALRAYALGLCLSAAGPAFADETGAAAAQAGASVEAVPADAGVAVKPSVALDEVVVTARKRKEKLQDVPVPIAAVGGRELERDNAVTVQDFTRKAPNLLVNAPNARQTSIAIRGLGKNSANDSMEPSVGVIVDNVFASHVGMSWADFVDIDRIEIARGPQGTLLGKNTTLGVLNVVTKKPGFTPEYQIETQYGTRDALIGKASASGPLIDGVLAYRASFYSNRRGGQLDNLYQTNETWLETNRSGGRLQLLAAPSETLTARIILDHSESSERINIDPYQLDPAAFADGRTRGTTYSSRLARGHFRGYRPLLGSVDTIDTNDARPLLTEQNGVSAEINWEVGGLTLTSISAYRDLDFDAKNDGDQTRFAIQRNGTLLSGKQITQEFRLASPADETIDYQAGLFYLKSEVSSTSRNLYGEDAGAFYASNAQYATLNASAAGRLLLRDSLKGVFFTTETRPETESVAAFGQLNWHITDKATLTLGLRDTYEDKSNSSNKIVPAGGADLSAADYAGATPQELAAAQAIRNGQTGNVYGFREGQGIRRNAVSWLINPSYKLSGNVLVYASAGYGEKSGAVQFDSNGNPLNVDPEKALDFELGFKSTLLGGALTLNANLYQTDVKDYQAQVQVVDASASTGYRSALSNVEKVRARGLELEAAYRPLDRLTLSFTGSFNDAEYVSFTNATCGPEADTALPCDYSGRRLPAAPRFIGNLGLDYQHPLSGGLLGTVFVNHSYRSGANLNANLSAYGWQDGYSLTDVGVGVTSPTARYDLSLVAKNVFDTDYATSIGNFSNSAAVGYTLGERRAATVVFRARF